MGLSEIFGPNNFALDLITIDAKPHLSAQGAWAELLTGRPWYENGCSGFSSFQPKGSELSSEDTLNRQFSLIREPAIVINLPLVKPGANRYWLGDGSLPLSYNNIDNTLVEQFLENYKPRRYISTKLVNGNSTKRILDLLDTELTRLALAEHLLKNTIWQTAFIRLNMFDTIQHAAGINFWQNQEFAWSEELQKGLKGIGQHIKNMINAAPNTTLCLISAYSHDKCLGRINLNEILHRGKFCRFDESFEPTSKRRLATAQMLQPDKKRAPLYMVARTNIPLFEHSRVFSPVSGALYSNKQNFLSPGKQDLELAIAFISNYLGSHIETPLEVFANPGQANGNDRTANCMLYLKGYDFYCTPGPTIDLIDKPDSCHTALGFVAILPPEGHLHQTSSIVNLTKTTQFLSELLEKPSHDK